MTGDPFLVYVAAAERHRACTAPDLTPEQFNEAVRFESGPDGLLTDDERCAMEAAPAECLCGRCDGQGRLRIDTAGAEQWTPCDGPSGYLPAAAADSARKAAAGDWR